MQAILVRPSILHVEDDDATAYLLKMTLQQEGADLDVVHLRDGYEAILFVGRVGIFADTRCPHVIVLDLHLPKRNGHEVLAEIRQAEAVQHVPIIMFTSSVSSADKEKALALGANHYIVKPVHLGGFVAVSKQVMEYVSDHSNGNATGA